MSTGHHPQTDGCSEITNRMIENYLRCFCDHKQRNWDELLTAVVFSYNSGHVENMNMLPFELDLGWQPKYHLELLSGLDSSVESIYSLKAGLHLAAQDENFAQMLVQSRQVAYNKKTYSPPTYMVGDSVWVSRKYIRPIYSSGTHLEKCCSPRPPFQHHSTSGCTC